MAQSSEDHKSSNMVGMAFYLFLIAITISFIVYMVPFQSIMLKKTAVEKVYYVDNISPAHAEIIELFNKQYSNHIEIVAVDLPFTTFTTNERKEIITRALRGNNAKIDVFAVDQIWVSRFARWAEKLDDLYSSEEIDNFLKYAIETCIVDSQLVSAPLYIDIGVMYYRKDIIDSVVKDKSIHNRLKDSITWEELIELKKEHFHDSPLYMFQGQNYEGLVCNYIEINGGNGGLIFDENSFHLDSRISIESAQFMNDIIYKYELSPRLATEFNENESYRYALTNDIPFIRGWPSMTSNIAVYPEDSSKISLLNVVALPHFEGNNPATVFGGWNLMIAKNSNVKDAAKIFIKFVQSKKIQQILYDSGGYLPIVNDLYGDFEDDVQINDLAYFKKLMAQGIHRPSLVNYTKISDIISTNLHEILKNTYDVDSTLKIVNELINPLVD